MGEEGMTTIMLEKRTESVEEIGPSEARKKALEEIEGAVCKDRQDDYGDAEDNFEHIRELWNWWLRRRGFIGEESELTRLDVAQMSAMIKIARKINRLDYMDNWVDDAGYNVCAAGMVSRKVE